MSERVLHPYTGIEISKTLQKHMRNARVDIEELPDTIVDIDSEIEMLEADIAQMDQQIELETAGATHRADADPEWPMRVNHARLYVARKRGVLRRWRRQLVMSGVGLPPKDDAIPAQMRADYQRAVQRRIDHFKRMGEDLKVHVDALSAIARNLPHDLRGEVWDALANARSAMTDVREQDEKFQESEKCLIAS